MNVLITIVGMIMCLRRSSKLNSFPVKHAGRRKHSELDGEDDNQHDTKPEDRDGESEEAERRSQIVHKTVSPDRRKDTQGIATSTAKTREEIVRPVCWGASPNHRSNEYPLE